MRAPAEDAYAPVEPTAERHATNFASLSDVRLADGSRFTFTSGSRPLPGYTIKRAVGRGGFGEVYYALSDGGKEVALKLVRRNLEIELRGVTQCLNLKHPHLLGLYDIRTDEHGDHWVVMEYVAGPSLEEVIADNPLGLATADAVTWFRGIAAGVGYLHDCGIVHRDLKPGNIFCEAGHVKIGDYGLSKFISCSRRSGQTDSIGTVHYMAPEVASGRYGREIDIYALGVMLYEMLTGRVPFEGESVAEVLMKHLTATPDLDGIQEPFRSVVAKALAKDPALRFATVGEMLAELPGEEAGIRVQGSGVRVQGSGIGDQVSDGPRRILRDAADVSPQELQGLTPPALQSPIEGTLPPAPLKPTLWAMATEEPIFRGVRRALVDFGAAWNERFSTPAKVVMILAGVWILLFAAGPLVPLLLTIGFVYSIYFTAWMIVRATSPHAVRRHSAAVETARPWRHAHAEQTAPEPVRAAVVATPVSQTTRRQRWHGRARQAMVVKSLRQRLAELCGSLVVSALASLVMTLVMFLLRGEQAAPQQFVWVALVSIAGAWGVLLPAKFWEGTDGEPALRRFAMLIVGLLVGVAAWAAQQSFAVPLPHEFKSGPLFAPDFSTAGASMGAPMDRPVTLISLMPYLTYFGFLFLLIRWWRLADPLRSTRLSLWATAVCVTCAMALYMFWPFPQRWEFFPQPWGFLVTAVMAIAVQLASPWQGKVKR